MTWNQKKGLLGIYIHNLKNQVGRTAIKGRNPFELVNVEVNSFFWGKQNRKLSDLIPIKDPWGWGSSGEYNDIKENLANWTEEAINTRKDL